MAQIGAYYNEYSTEDIARPPDSVLNQFVDIL